MDAGEGDSNAAPFSRPHPRSKPQTVAENLHENWNSERGHVNAIDLVAATVDTFVGIVEHTIFVPHLVDGRAPTRGVVFTEDVVKIAGEQGRYAVGHGASLGR